MSFNWREENWDPSILDVMYSDEEEGAFYIPSENEKEKIKIIKKGLCKLSLRERQVITLLFFDGSYSVAEIAEALQISECSVREYALRGKKKLVEYINSIESRNEEFKF